jgi:hypothetical protein
VLLPICNPSYHGDGAVLYRVMRRQRLLINNLLRVNLVIKRCTTTVVLVAPDLDINAVLMVKGEGSGEWAKIISYISSGKFPPLFSPQLLYYFPAHFLPLQLVLFCKT